MTRMPKVTDFSAHCFLRHRGKRNSLCLFAVAAAFATPMYAQLAPASDELIAAPQPQARLARLSSNLAVAQAIVPGVEAANDRAEGSSSPRAASSTTADIPAEPEQRIAANAPPAGTPSGAPPIASVYTKYIPAGWAARPLSGRDKIVLGARDLYSPFTLLGDVAVAAYAHGVNGEPNYGTNSEAFGKRFGATALRDASQGVFTDMVLAPILHQDSRYYVQGSRYGFLHRAFTLRRALLSLVLTAAGTP